MFEVTFYKLQGVIVNDHLYLIDPVNERHPHI